VNRKQWIVAGVIAALLVAGLIFLSSNDLSDPVETGQNAPVSGLAYCADEQVRPCVVSFSVDADDNMLVNLLLPASSFPSFYLEIARGGSETVYTCRRNGSAADNAYCTGPKQPPGETLTLRLISSRDETLLAQGDLSIIGLAFPTLGVAVTTPQEEAPAAVLITTITPTSPSFLPTRTRPLPTFPTLSYPNPSYPNPTSYP
jgi:hypothetical protein